MSAESWKPLPEWEGLYEISDQGRVRSLPRTAHRKPGRVLKPIAYNNGYQWVSLTGNGRRGRAPIHRTVLLAFVGPCPDGMQACHNNGDKSNNALSNLRWDTVAANAADRTTHGTAYRKSEHITHCIRGHEFDDANTSRDPQGNRRCRTCTNQRERAKRAARRIAATSTIAAVTILAPVAAIASGNHGTGSDKRVVCHNVTHNPHIIVVDDDSTKLHAHLAHRTQSQLMDLVEGFDGTAAQIRAACVPAPTPSPTIPTTATPSPTSTGSTPSATTTSSPSASTTSSTPTTSGPKPSPSWSTTATTSPSGTPTAPSQTSRPSTSTPRPSGSFTPSETPVASTTSPRRSVPSSTVAPPERLARTGAGLGLAGVGVVLFGGGVFLIGACRRMGAQH